MTKVLTLNEIIQFLEPNQVKIPIKTDGLHLEKNLPAFVGEFVEKYLPKDKQYYTCPPLGKNHFMAAFLYMTDPQFPGKYRDTEREEAIQELRKTMGYQLDEKNLHAKFGYTRKRKFKKVDLQKNLFQLQKPIEEIDSPINQYLVDFFSVNIFIINADTQKITPLLANLDDPNMLKPTFFMFVESGFFYPLVTDEMSYYILSKHAFLNDLYLKFSKIKTTDEVAEEEEADEAVTISEEGDAPEEEPNPVIDLNKLTVKELQKMATDKSISIWKKSDKTAKNIFKKKHELIEDLSAK
jgi:hypothetical protein